jgi:hypothetical protein
MYSIANKTDVFSRSKQMLVRSRVILTTVFVSGDKSAHEVLRLGS